MEKLIELRTFCVKAKSNAGRKADLYRDDKHKIKEFSYQSGRYFAFDSLIKKLDLILNNSCVKPTDSRSPEGQGKQSGVSRPNDSQNPTDEQP